MQTNTTIAMKQFDRNTYMGTPLDSINASIYCGTKCTRKIEGQLANFVLGASYANDFSGTGETYIDMHSAPLPVKIHNRQDSVYVTGMVRYGVTKEKKVNLVVNGKPLPNPSTVIEITSHLVLLVKDYTTEEVYVNPHKLFQTCNEWAEFKRAFARSSWNRR